jgi:hypothetical protein
MEPRDEFLERIKNRALEYLDRDHNPREAFTSMLSDLRKHPELENHPGGTIGVGFMLIPGWIDNPHEVRRWIVGFR